MATPGRLNELICPRCQSISWVIDNDYRGLDAIFVPYGERRYVCRRCRHDGAGWGLGEQSPSAFFLQPYCTYPMSQESFDYWVGILRTNFPADPRLKELGTSFRPCLPEEAAAERRAHAQRHPVGLMTDQDGARRQDPDFERTKDWVDMMKPGDSLFLKRRDGGLLCMTLDETAYSARCLDPSNQLLAEASGLTMEALCRAAEPYLLGDVSGCIERLKTPR